MISVLTVQTAPWDSFPPGTVFATTSPETGETSGMFRVLGRNRRGRIERLIVRRMA